MPEETATVEPDASSNETQQQGEEQQQPPADDSEAARWREFARTWEKRAKQHEKELEKLRTAQMSDQERIVADARREGATEAMTRTNERLLRAEVRAAAAGRFNDPEDAVRFLDMAQFSIDDDGEVDQKALGTAVTKLLEAKPYLAAGATARGPGSADQGLNGGGPAPRGDDMNALIRRSFQR